jgi:hypothetical protein
MYCSAVLLAALLILVSMHLCGGRLVYSLDDAYIHLSVSEQIARGGYGINPGEFSAPSSSILWDFLLAPFAGSPVHEFVPLLLNVAFLLWSLELLRRLAGALLPGAGPWAVSLAALWFAVGLNLFGLVLTGMEHNLQISLTLAVLLGVTRISGGGKTGRGAAAAMILGPVVRYELLAVTGAAAVVMFLQGRRKTAVLLTAAALAVPAVFSLYLVSRGLPPLPGSVLTKLAEGGFGGSLAGSLLGRARSLVSDMDGFRLAFLLALTPAALVLCGNRESRLVVLFGLLAGTAHVLAGRYGWFGRYHIYILAAIIPSLAWPFRNRLGRIARPPGAAGRLALLVLPLTVFLLPEIAVTVKTPLASRVIRLQHGVMRSIALTYGERVAVNDIGWVSYRNPDHVLDLWGLANDESRRHCLERGTGWVGDLVERDGAGLVMIYADLFQGEIPPEWIKAATLGMSGPVVVGFPVVDIFVTPAGDPERVANLLYTVSEGLPEGAFMKICPAEAASAR